MSKVTHACALLKFIACGINFINFSFKYSIYNLKGNININVGGITLINTIVKVLKKSFKNRSAKELYIVSTVNQQ